jgi:hypothetical protein
MSDDNDDVDAVLYITIKRKTKEKKKDDRFEVEKRSDGLFYITKVPKNCAAQTIGVGDRVLEINGTKYSNFKNQKNANSLLDSFRLEV